MNEVVILDTSIFCDVVEVPGRCQRRPETMEALADLVESGARMLLPLVAVYETGNHIAQVKDGDRHAAAWRFVEQVKGAMEGKAPWSPMDFPLEHEMRDWLGEFPDRAAQGVSIGDLSIIKVWEHQCQLNRRRRVRIWSHDQHLQGYDRR